MLTLFEAALQKAENSRSDELACDDLIITGSPEFLTWFLEKIKKQFTVGHEDKNDLTFTGQRVRWVFDSNNQKKYISIDQKLCVSELSLRLLFLNT